MATVTPAALVQGATRQPLPYGLFSTFTFRPGGADAGRWEGGGVTFEHMGCEPVAGIGPWQCPSDETPGLPKVVGVEPGAVGTDGTAVQFTVYGHFSCSPVGWTPQQAEARALEHLLTREEARVEQAFWTADLSNAPSLEDAGTTDISVAGAGPAEVIGLLESWIATNYGSLGTIHMTRQAALIGIGLGVLMTSGGQLRTALGTPVAAGSGNPGTGPAGEAAAASTSWMFVTPSLFGYRSDPFSSSNRPGDLLVRASNDLYAVAERTYLLGFDPCGVAAALATLTAV